MILFCRYTIAMPIEFNSKTEFFLFIFKMVFGLPPHTVQTILTKPFALIFRRLTITLMTMCRFMFLEKTFLEKQSVSNGLSKN